MDTVTFIQKSKDKFGDKFDYRNTEYINKRTKLCVICREHESFYILPLNHLNGSGGCRKCMITSFRNRSKYTQELFISECNLVHGNKYDYSLVEYKNVNSMIDIICPDHGVFTQIARSHKDGCGCKQCGTDRQKQKETNNTEYFINKSNNVHGFKYDYSKSIYTANRNKIEIICPIHGSFIQIAANHIAGAECPECAKVSSALKTRNTTDYFVDKCNVIHNGFYSYDKSIYNTNKDKVVVTCPIHGDFNVIANNHLNGSGCLQCGYELSGFSRSSWCKKAKNRVGVFYIIRCYNNIESFYKYGITFNSLSRRYKTNAEMPYEYDIIRLIISSDKEYIWDLEKRFRRFKAKDRYSPNIPFAGSTYECFSNYSVIDRTR